MIPERYRELLTAYVDGELSARQRRHALRLLRRSSEARRLLQQLQSDSNALIHLPRVRPERDLAAAVLDKIAAQPLPMRRSSRRPVLARAYPVWAGAAAAAAVLFGIGAASYWFFSSLDRPAASAVVARNLHPSTDTKPTADAGHDSPPPTHPDPAPKPKPDPASHPTTDDVAHRPTDPPPAPEKDEPVFTSEGMEMFVELKSVVPSIDVPATFKLHDLNEDAARRKLVAEFQKEALRLELPVPDGSRAFERLEAVLKSHHVDLMIDATAQRRLAKSALRTNYVLYSEDLTADELARLLEALGADDRKAAEKKAGDGLFDALVVRRLTEKDHKELADLLGVDPMPVQPSKEVGPLGVDPHKPLSELTGSQIAASLGQPKAGAERLMLAMPYNPVRPRRDSAEIKHFLDERRPLRSGAVPFLLVLRGPTK